jgi:hypothetical protein
MLWIGIQSQQAIWSHRDGQPATFTLVQRHRLWVFKVDVDHSRGNRVRKQSTAPFDGGNPLPQTAAAVMKPPEQPLHGRQLLWRDARQEIFKGGAAALVGLTVGF